MSYYSKSNEPLNVILTLVLTLAIPNPNPKSMAHLSLTRRPGGLSLHNVPNPYP